MNISDDGSVVECVDPVDFPRILKFLSSHLQDVCHIYNFIASAIRSKNPSYCVYILRNREDNKGVDKPLAIVGSQTLRFYVQSSKEMKPKRAVITWSSTDFNAILKICQSIDFVDWARDALYMLPVDHDEEDSRLNDLLSTRFREKSTETSSIGQYVMEISTALDLTIEIPEEVYVDSLKPFNAQQVYEFFPYRQSVTLEDVTDEIEQLPSVGVFLKENHQLVSWMIQRSSFGMGRLFTLEAHRRRGYALLTVRSLSKKMAEAGFFPLLYVNHNNHASKSLMIKAGFRYKKSFAWLLVEPSNHCSLPQ